MTLPLNTAPGPPPDEESERHALISHDLLHKASLELDKGELLQASEKAWAAAAHAIKAVAEKRRWFSEADWKLRGIANIVATEQQDNSIVNCYLATRNAHFNFYHHHYDAIDVGFAIAAAAELVTKMTATLVEDYDPPHVSEEIDSWIRALEQPTSDPDRERLINGRPTMEQRPPAITPQE